MWLDWLSKRPQIKDNRGVKTKQNVDFQTLPKLLTIDQVCEILHVHPNTLRNWDRSGKLKAERIGTRRDRRYAREAIEKMYKELKPEPKEGLEPIAKVELPKPVESPKPVPEKSYVIEPGFSWRKIHLFLISRRFTVFVYTACLVAVGFATVQIGFFSYVYRVQAEAKKQQTFSYQLEPASVSGWQSPTKAQHIDLKAKATTNSFNDDNSAIFSNSSVTGVAGETTTDVNLSQTSPEFKAFDFALPKDSPEGGTILKANIIFSLAATTFQGNEDVVTLEYTLDGTAWSELANIPLNTETSNDIHGGYWSYPLDLINFTTDQVSTLQVRVKYNAVAGSGQASAYLDGVALAMDIQEAAPVTEQVEQAVTVSKKDFKSNEKPTFSVAVENKKILGIGTKKRTIKEVHITGPRGNEVKQADIEVKNNSKGSITTADYSVDTSKFTMPGHYKVDFVIEQDEQNVTVTRDFSWGVLVLNTMKSVYRPEETVKAGMGVLDAEGRTICDAQLVINITAPDGSKKTFSTKDGTISTSEECGLITVTSVPDYATEFIVEKTGDYQLKLTATTAAGDYTIDDTVHVQNDIVFDITRLGPTRIWPRANYQMYLEVIPAADYTGTLEEYVPSSFEIPRVDQDGLVSNFDDTRKVIRWIVDWKAGQPYTLSYEMDPPNVSPELFLLGPAKVGEFTELRQWQIASDATCTSGGSGNWNNGGTWTGCGINGPVAGDSVVIKAGHMITIPTPLSAAAADITIQANSSGTQNGLTFTDKNSTLAISGAMSIAAASNASGSLVAVDAGVITTSGGTTSLAIAGSGTLGQNSVFRISTGSATFNSTVTFSGTAGQAQLTFTGGGTLSCLTLGAGGTFTKSTGTVKFTNTGAYTLTAYSYHSLEIAGTNTVTTGANTSLSGNLTVSSASGTFRGGANFSLTVTGNTSVTGSLTNVAGATGTYTFTGTVTVKSGGVFNPSTAAHATIFANNITIDSGATTFNKGAGTTTFQTNAIAITNNANITATFGGAATANIGVTFSGAYPITFSSTFAIGSGRTMINNNTNAAGVTITGNLTGADGTSIWSNGLNTGGAVATFTAAVLSTGVLTPSTSNANTVIYNGAGQTVKNPSANYYHLTLSGSGTVTLPGALTTTGNFTVSGSVTTSLAGNFSVGGNLTHSGTSLTVGSTFTISVTGTTTISSSFVISASANSETFVGLVTLQSGATWNNSGNRTVTFQGGLTNDSSNAHTFGSGVQTFDTNDQNIGGSYAISIPSVTSGTAAKALTNTGTLTVTTALAGGGNFTNTGNLHLDFTGAMTLSGTFTASADANLVDYGFAGVQTVAPVTYHDLTLSTSGTKTMTSVATINGDFTLTGSAAATTDALATVGGNIVLDTTATLTIGTVALCTVTGDLTVGTGTTLTIGASTTINGGDITVTSTGALATSGTPTLTMGSSGAISGTGNVTIYDLATSGTGTTTLSATGTNLITDNVTVGSGTTLTFSTSSGATINGGTNGGVTANGAFNVTTGTVNIGNGTDEDLNVVGGAVNFSGGTINIKDDLIVGSTTAGGSIVMTTTVNINGNGANSLINQDGGTITIDTGANVTFSGNVQVNQLSGNTTVFNMNGGTLTGSTSASSGYGFNGGTFNLNGGSMYTGTNAVIEFARNANGNPANEVLNMTGGDLYTRGLNVYANGYTFTNSTLTGGTIHIGQGAGSPSIYDMNVSVHQFYNITIDTNTTIQQAAATGIPVKNLFTISSGKTFATGSYNMQVDGGWVNNGAGFTSSGTVTLRGGNISGSTDTTFNNLTIIEGAAPATVTVNGTDDPTVAGTLDVDTGDVLSIGSGRTVTHTGSAMTLDGTISGAGTMIFTNTSSGPGTSGTLSALVRYDSTGGNIANTTFDARTYGSTVTAYSNFAGIRSIAMGAGTQQFNVDLTIVTGASQSGVLTLDASANPTVNINGQGGLYFTKGGSATPAITLGTGTWTVIGDVILTDGTIDATGNNFIMKPSGGSQSLTSAGNSFNNFQLSTVGGGDLDLNDALDINGALTIDASTTLRQNATANINIADDFTIESGGTFTKSATSGKLILDGDLYFWDKNASPNDLGVVEIGTSPDTTTLKSNLKASSLAVKSGDSLITDGYDIDINTGGITIDGAINATAGTGGATLITSESTWTMNSGGSFTADSSTVTFDGTSANIAGTAGTTFNNLTIASSVTVTASDHTVSGTLTVNSSKTLTINSGRIVTHTGATLTWGNSSSTITGAGTLRFTDASGGPSTGGVVSVPVQYDATNGDIASSTVDIRTYSNSVEFYSGSASTRTITLAGGGTYTLSGTSSNMSAYASGNGNLNVEGSTNNPAVTIGGNLSFTAGAGQGSPTITSGTGIWTVSKDVNFSFGTYTATDGNKIIMNGSGTLTSNGQALHDLTLSGTSITLASAATHTVFGDLVISATSLTPGTSTIAMSGASASIQGGGKTLYNLTISGAAVNLSTSDLTVSHTLTVNNGKVLTIDIDRILTSAYNSTVSLSTSGTIAGPGTLLYKSGSNFPTGGTLSEDLVLRFDGADYMLTTFTPVSSRTYEYVEVDNSSASGSPSVGMTSGTIAINHDLTVLSSGGGAVTLTAATNHPAVTVGGSLNITAGGGTKGIVSGSGTWTVNGGSLANGTFTATSGNTFIIDHSGGTALFTSAGTAFYNFQTSATGGGGNVSTDALDINGTLTVTANSILFAGASDVEGAVTINASGTLNQSGNLNFAENFTLDSGATFVKSSTGGKVIFDGDLDFRDNTAGLQDLGDVEIGTSPDTTELKSNMKATSLKIQGGDSLITHGYDLDIGGDITVIGTLTTTNDLAGNSTIINLTGSLDIQSTATFTQADSTVIFDGTTSNLITDGAFSLYNLKLDAPVTVTVEDALDVDNDLWIHAGNLDVKSGENNSISVGGNWTNDDTFIPRSGIVTFDATTTGKTISPGASSFNNVIFNGAGGEWAPSGTLSINGDLTVTAGTLIGTSSISVSGGDITCGLTCGTINMTGGTTTLAGTGNLGAVDLASNWTFNSLTLSASPGDTTAQGTGTITVTSVFTIGGQHGFNAGSANPGKTYVLSGTGTPFVIGALATLNGGTSTFKYTGNDSTNITASANYNNLQILPGAASKTHTLASGTFTLSGNLTLGDGAYASTVINADTNDPTINVVGNLVICASPCNNQMTYTASASATTTLKPTGTKTWEDNNVTKQSVGIVAIASGSSTPKIQLVTGVKASSVTVSSSHELLLNSKDLYLDNASGLSLATQAGAVVSCTGCISGTVTLANGTGFGGGGGTESLNFFNLTFGSNTTFFSSFSVMGTLTLHSSINDSNGKTVTMNLSGGSIVGNGATLYNLTIDPSSAGTVTLNTSDLNVTSALNVASGDILSLSSGRTMTLQSSGTLTLDGTISGDGRLTYMSKNAFPTTGTISSILRFDSADTAQEMSARTFGGPIEVYNSSGSGYDLVAAAGSITLNSSLHIMDDGGTSTLELNTNDPTMHIDGAVLIDNSCYLSAPSANPLYLGGDYDNEGQLTNNNGTIIFDGTDLQTITGLLSVFGEFANVTVTNSSGTDPEADPSVIFNPGWGSPFIVTGTFTAATPNTKIVFTTGGPATYYGFVNMVLNGQASGTRVYLRSSSPSTQWELNVGSSAAVSNVNVKDSNACPGIDIDVTDGTSYNAGNNDCWNFADISGSSNESSGTVALAFDNVRQDETGTISGGTWNINVPVMPALGTVVTVWIDGAADANESTGVTKYDGSGSISGMVLNQHVLTIGSADNASLTVVNLSRYDHDQDEDISHDSDTIVAPAVFSVDGGNSYADDKIDILSGNTLTLIDTDVLNAHDVAINGTLTFSGTGNCNVSGSWDNNGDFNSATEMFTFNSTTTETIDSTGATDSDIYNAAFDGLGGQWTLTTALVINNDMTVIAGTVTGSQNLTVSGGDLVCSGTCGTINMTAGTTTLAGTGNFGANSLASDWTFYSLTLGDATSDSTTALGTGTITILKNFIVSANQTLNAGGKTWVIDSTGTPFTLDGTLVGDTSTFRYTGGGATAITASTGYNNLEIKPGFTGATHTLAGSTFTLSGNLQIGDGLQSGTTIDAATNDPTINVAGNIQLASPGKAGDITFTPSSNTLTLKPTGTKTWTDYDSTPQDLGIVSIASGASTPVIQLATGVKATSVAIAAGHELQLNSKNLTLSGALATASNGTITCASCNDGTVTARTTLGGGSGAITFYNLILDNTTTLSSSFTVLNDLTLPASVTAGTTTVTMTGTDGALVGGGATLYNLTINPASAGSITLNTSDISLSSNLNVAADDEFSISAGRTATVNNTGSLTLTGTISGDGRLTFKASEFPGTGTITSTLRMDATNNDQTAAVRTYGGPVEFYSSNAGTPRTTITNEGALDFSSTVDVMCNSCAGMTFDTDYKNATITIDDDLTIEKDATFVASGVNDLTLGGNYSNSGIFTNSSGTVVANGTSQQTFSGDMTTSTSSAFNNLIITNAGAGNPDVIFSADADVAVTFTAITAGTQLQFLAGGDYTFENFTINGQAENTRVFLRSSSTGTEWNLITAGDQSVSNTNVRDSNACGGDTVDASDGTSFDATNNSCWLINTLTFSISDDSIGFGDFNQLAAKWATGDGQGTDSQPAVGSGAHTLNVSSNADNGYALTYYGTDLASSNDSITAATITGDGDGTPGSKQFALAASSATATIPLAYSYDPNNNYNYVPTTVTTLASNSSSIVNDIIYAYYIANISGLTKSGQYSANITYIITATF